MRKHVWLLRSWYTTELDLNTRILPIYAYKSRHCSRRSGLYIFLFTFRLQYQISTAFESAFS